VNPSSRKIVYVFGFYDKLELKSFMRFVRGDSLAECKKKAKEFADSFYIKSFKHVIEVRSFMKIESLDDIFKIHNLCID